MRKVCILDYGMGNVRSIINSFKKLKLKHFSIAKKNSDFDVLIIPGVGSFDAAMKIIRKKYISNLLIKPKVKKN